MVAQGRARQGAVVDAARFQHWDDELGRSKLEGSGDHEHANQTSLLIGHHIARYWFADGIRGVDYLVGRPDVIADRIGTFGCSGGGTAAAYLAASKLDSSAERRAQQEWLAVECWLDAGDIHEAMRVADNAARTGGSDLRRSAAVGRLAIVTGRFDEAVLVLQEAWAQPSTNGDYESLRRSIAEQVATVFLVYGRGADAATWGRRALRSAWGPGE